MKTSSDKHVVVVGCGGNVGSHVNSHLARIHGVGRVTLIDHDVYEPKNLRAHDVVPSDIGKPKAVVQARRLRRINPALEVEAITESIEEVPLGRLRGSDAILAAVDSRRARQVINLAAWRLNTVWLDSGVDGGSGLARVTVFVPGKNSSCLECGWTKVYYDTLEQTYPCTLRTLLRAGERMPPPTNATSSLGALAASILVTECEKVLFGSQHGDGSGYQVLMDAKYHNLYLWKLTHDESCRMPQHRQQPIGEVSVVSPAAKIGELFDEGAARVKQVRGGADGESGARLQVLGQSFVAGLTCEECGHRRASPRLKVSLRGAPPPKCRLCGGKMVAAGFDTIDHLNELALPPRARNRSLRGIGVRVGDLLCINRAADQPRYLEVGGRDSAGRVNTEGKRTRREA